MTQPWWFDAAAVALPAMTPVRHAPASEQATSRETSWDVADGGESSMWRRIDALASAAVRR